MTRVYYKEAVGALIVFDLLRDSTFEAVLKWKNDLDAKVQLLDCSGIPCVLLANKVCSLHHGEAPLEFWLGCHSSEHYVMRKGGSLNLYGPVCVTIALRELFLSCVLLCRTA